jgi:hypothetical protein
MMQSTRRPWTAVVIALALLLLPACAGEAEADPEAWAAALEDVPGVTSADVDFDSYGTGEFSHVVVRTDTNDPVQLETVLRDSIRRFVDVTADMDTFGLDYSVRTADGNSALYPEGIGWNGGTIGFLRDDVAAGDDG